MCCTPPIKRRCVVVLPAPVLSVPSAAFPVLLQAAPYLNWLLPCILIIAMVACAAVLLELRYQKLIRSGLYNPRTCTLSNAGPGMPLARIRTHRCGALLSTGCHPTASSAK